MLSPVNSFVFNNVDGDHNIVDNSQDHSTNIGPKAGAMTKNMGFGAGATNNGPGARGINYNYGPGAGSINSGACAGSTNADSINRGALSYHSLIPTQNQYSPQSNDPIPYDPTTWFNHNPDFDDHYYYHHNSIARSGYQNSPYHHKSTAGSKSVAEGDEGVTHYNHSDSIIPTALNKGARVQLDGNTHFLIFDD